MSFKQFEYDNYPTAPVNRGAILLSGYAFKSQDFCGMGIPVIKIKNIQNALVTCTDSQYVSKDLITKKLEKYLLKNGDVLIAMTGQGSVGRVGRLQCKNHERPVMNQRVGKFITDEKTLNKDYLHYVISSKFYEEQLFAMGSGSGQPNLSPSMILSLEIPFPPYPEQVAIASTLNSLDDRITLLRETNTTLEAIAQALFKSWFVDFDPVHAKMQGLAPEGMDEATAALFPDSFEESELGAVPKGWRIGSLADLATFQNGYAFKSKDWSEAGHPVIKIGNVKPSLISFDGCSFVSAESVIGLDRFKLKRGDLLVGMTGYVGEAGLVTEVSPRAYLNQRVGRIATSAGVKDLGFVFCLTRHEDFKAFAEGQSHGSAQANVSGSDLLKFKSVIPIDIVLSAFNEMMETSIESLMSNYERVQLLGQLRDSLLPRLISGQIQLGTGEI
jgi:type I restriction enzyme S subunit